MTDRAQPVLREALSLSAGQRAGVWAGMAAFMLIRCATIVVRMRGGRWARATMTA